MPTFDEEVIAQLPQQQTILGQGGFGTVFKIQTTHGTFALKKISLKDTYSIRRELDAGERLFRKHNNIINCRKLEYNCKSSIYFVMDYCSYGNLEGFVNKYMYSVSREQSIEFMRQIIDGLNFLHAEDIIHRDLKPENILVKGDLTCVIADFGLSKLWNDTTNDMADFHYRSMIGTYCGTKMYMAPEVRKHMRYSFKADTYACGMIFKFLMNGERGKYFMILQLRKADPDCRHIDATIQQMMSFDPKERPTTESVKTNLLRYQGCFCGRAESEVAAEVGVGLVASGIVGAVFPGVGLAMLAYTLLRKKNGLQKVSKRFS